MSNPRITIVGRIGQDPQPVGSGLRLRVATNERKKNESGNYEDGKTSWWTVKLWKNQAENAKGILKKGQEVVVVGNIYEEIWTDKSGQQKNSYEIVADNVAVTTYTLKKNNTATLENSGNFDTWLPESESPNSPF